MYWHHSLKQTEHDPSKTAACILPERVTMYECIHTAPARPVSWWCCTVCIQCAGQYASEADTLYRTFKNAN